MVRIDENFNRNDLKNLISFLEDPTYDISSCLTNCSNKGVCKMNKLGSFQCECIGNYTGCSCQFNINPCSRDSCINNSTCLIHSNNSNGFECLCQHGYYGQICEKKIDLCQNISCSNNGYCMEYKSKTKCICKKYYSSDECKVQDQQLVIIKAVISTLSQ